MILIQCYYLVSNIFIAFIKTFLDKSEPQIQSTEFYLTVPKKIETTEYNLQKRQLFVIDLILIKRTKI